MKTAITNIMLILSYFETLSQEYDCPPDEDVGDDHEVCYPPTQPTHDRRRYEAAQQQGDGGHWCWNGNRNIESYEYSPMYKV